MIGTAQGWSDWATIGLAVHETGIHGGPSPREAGVVAAAAGVFGTVVLLKEALG